MHKLRVFAGLLLIIGLCAAPLQARQGQDWSFDGVDRIDIDGVSGDVIVRAGDGSAVRVVLDENVTPQGNFRGEVAMSGGTVSIRERWEGRNSRGRVTWTLTVPADANLRISAETASGDLEASQVRARFDFSTASGDVRLSDMTLAADSSFSTASGDLELTGVTVGDYVEMSTASGNVELTRVTATDGFKASTASGNVVIEDSEGVLEASSASGDVRVRDSRMTGRGEFSSASGDVSMTLEGAVTQDLEVSSASGDVSLEADFGSDFTLVMTRRRDRGSFDSPFEATSEEEFERNGRTYVRRTVVHGSGGPEIRLSTASGTVRVRQR